MDSAPANTDATTAVFTRYAPIPTPAQRFETCSSVPKNEAKSVGLNFLLLKSVERTGGQQEPLVTYKQHADTRNGSAWQVTRTSVTEIPK